YEHFSVRTRMAMLQKEFSKAEKIFIQQHRVDDAMKMYQELHRWEDTIRVAEEAKRPDTENLKAVYFKWLLKSKQEEKAGKIREKEGKIEEAVDLFLRGCVPSEAARLVLTYTQPAPGAVNISPYYQADRFGRSKGGNITDENIEFKEETLQQIVVSLERVDLFAKTGEILEHLGRFEQALSSYCKGHAYQPALNLARSVAPQSTSALEEEWGIWLESQKQVDSAIVHLILSGNVTRAIQAAVKNGLWERAQLYLKDIMGSSTKRAAEKAKGQKNLQELQDYAKQIAQYYEKIMNYASAREFYILAGSPKDALAMLCRAGLFETAQRLENEHFGSKGAPEVYIAQAQELEKSGKMKDAEKLYILVHKPELAYDMYKRHKLFDEAIRIAATMEGTKDTAESAKKAHLEVAQLLEKEGKLKEAEKHYIDAREFSQAIQLYRGKGMWDDALRVAKACGGQKQANEIALVRATAAGGEAGVQLLISMSLPQLGVDFACDCALFDLAFQVAREHCPQKLDDAKSRQGKWFQQQRRYADAERAFIAGKAYKNCVSMYTQLQDFTSAKRIAEAYDRSLLDDVLVGEAKLCMDAGELQQAEQLLSRAHKPQLTVGMYVDAGRWRDALRIAKDVDGLVKSGQMSQIGKDKGKAGQQGDINQEDFTVLRNLYRNTVDRYADYLKSSGVLEHATVAEL
ncbi:MAG: putative Intraflagellar transport protein 172, partial [Streblomastix strix]